MQLLILLFPARLLDVPAYHLLVAVLADCAHVIAIRPELAAPQLLLHLWTGRKDFSRRDALDDLHNLLRAIHRHRLHQKMDVVFVRADLQKRDLMPLADFDTNLFKFLVYLRAKDHSTILRWTNDVVQQHRNVMALVDEATHSFIIISQQAAGN